MQYCESCKIDYPGGKKFCRKCGGALVEKAEPRPVEALSTRCGKCGNPVARGKKFCRYCGAAIEETPAEFTPGLARDSVPRPTVESSESLPVSSPRLLPSETPASVAVLEINAPAAVSDASAASPNVKEIEPAVQPMSEFTAVLEQEAQIAPPTFLSNDANAVTEQREASSVAKQYLPFIATAAVIGLAIGGYVLWSFVFSAEARMIRAISRGDIVTPVGKSAYDLYLSSRAGLSGSERLKIKEKALGKVLEAANAIVQRRTQGESMLLSEVEQLGRLYNWAAELDPYNQKVLAGQDYAQGVASLIGGKPQVALLLLLQATQHDSTWAPPFNELGKTYVKLNDHYHAADAYTKAIAADPNWVYPKMNLAGVYLHEKQWNEAEAGYWKAIRTDVTLATPWYFLGQVYEAQHRPDVAVGAYERAVSLAQTKPSSAFRVDALQERLAKLKAQYGPAPAPPEPSQAAPLSYAARLYNCDDECRLVISGRTVLISTFAADTGWVDLNRYLAQGSNPVLLQVWNREGAITYGFQVSRDSQMIFDEQCGQASTVGCDNNAVRPSGIARQYSLTLVK